jgi:flagellar FliL protein
MASAAAPAPAPKKKGKSMLLIIVGALVLTGAGIGGGIYAASSGLLGGEEADAAEKDVPKLVPKGSKPKKEEGEGESKSEGASGGEAPKYESSYFQLEKEFTSNLKDSAHLIQVGLAVSTNYDERVIENLKGHELAVRSAVLMTLSETDEEHVFTADGKKDLQRRLAKAINDTLKEKEGFGGVGNVYFTNFIVQ